MEQKRTCKLCGKTAKENEFVKDKTQKGGYRNKCRECHNGKNVEWRKDNLELNREIQKEYAKRRRIKEKLEKQK